MIRKTEPESIAPYLRDASNYSEGQASEVVVPENREELIDFLKSNEQPITVAGAGTGLTASRVPLAGIIVSLERFQFLGGVENGSIIVGPAVSLQQLKEHLQGSGWFYPPNPTEWLASLGGTLATNASGSRSYKFGSTREYVEELEIVLVDGRSTRIKRGHKVDRPLDLDDGSQIDFPEVNYRSPECKNAAGYFVQPGMDWVDLFVGSDGTLALFTSARLKLFPSPDDFLSGILFFEKEEACWQLVSKIRDSDVERINPCSLEYFDRFSLKRLKPKFSSIPSNSQAALFFEQDIERSEDLDPAMEAWYEFLESENVSLEDSWFAQSAKDIEKFHDFRHQLPLSINEENSRLGRTKMGTDMAVESEHYFEMMHFYQDQLSRSALDFAMFGHIGDNHLHINLLPEPDQMELAKETYDTLVRQVLEWGGTVSAEHGIGKLKKPYYFQMVGKNGLEELRLIKRRFDPEGRLGSGNLL